MSYSNVELINKPLKDLPLWARSAVFAKITNVNCSSRFSGSRATYLDSVNGYDEQQLYRFLGTNSKEETPIKNLLHKGELAELVHELTEADKIVKNKRLRELLDTYCYDITHEQKAPLIRALKSTGKLTGLQTTGLILDVDTLSLSEVLNTLRIPEVFRKTMPIEVYLETDTKKALLELQDAHSQKDDQLA